MNCKTTDLLTPLHLACQYNHKDVSVTTLCGIFTIYFSVALCRILIVMYLVYYPTSITKAVFEVATISFSF